MEDDGEGQRGWRFASVLVLGMASTVFIVPATAVLAPELNRELGLTAGGIGGLLSLLYAVSAAGSLLMGRFIGRVGSRRALVVMYGLVLAGTALFAAAPSYAWLLAASAVLGAALTVANPVTNHLVAERAAPASRGSLIGWKQAGGQFAFFVAGVSLPVALRLWGWRGAALGGAVLAALGLVATLLVVTAGDGTTPGGPLRPVVADVHHVRVVLLCAYSFLMSAGISAFNSFLPLYLEDDLGLGTGAAGSVVALMGVASVAGRVLWSSTARGSGVLLGRLTLLSTAAVLATALMAASGAVGVPLAWIAALLMGAMATAWSAIVSLVIVQQFGVGGAARASGVVMTTIHLGLLATPIAVGRAIDGIGGYGVVWLASGALFAAAVVVSVVSGRQAKSLTRDSCAEGEPVVRSGSRPAFRPRPRSSPEVTRS